MLFADLALARRLESARTAGNLAYQRSREWLRPGSTASLPVAGGQAVFVGVRSPISRVTGLGMTQAVSAEDLDQAEAFYRTHNTPVLVDLCPLAHGSLATLLGRRGYTITGFRNVLVRPLDPEEVLSGPPRGVRVTKAAPHDADLWVRVVESGFAGQDDLTPGPDSLVVPVFYADGVTCFLAWSGAEPGAGGALAVRGATGILLSTSTRLSFRGRGLQTALIGARLRAAAVAGCDLAKVETTPGSASQRNLERAGFRVAYTVQTMALD